jgi:fatty acid desaturase
MWPWEWAILDWYCDLSPLVRVIIALVVLGACAVGWFFGVVSPWLFIVGVVLLFFAFPSDSEKKGYNF